MNFYGWTLLLAIAHMGVVFFSALVLGRKLSGPLLGFDHPALRGAFQMAIGLLVYSLLFFGVVTVGAARPEVFWLLTVFMIGSIIPEFSKLASIKRYYFPALTLFAGYFFWMALQAALPPGARDELIYHLEIPKRILQAHGWVHFRDNIYGYFPHFSEMYFLYFLATCGETGARLFHVATGGLMAMAVYGFSRSWMDRFHASIAAGLVLLSPVVMDILPVAYVDVTYALYFFLGLICMMNFLEKEDIRWAVAGGLMIGGLITIKYTGIQTLILLGVLWLISEVAFLRDRTSGRVNRLKGILLLGVMAVLVSAPYFIRNWIQTGWPLYPFHTLGLPLKEGFNWDVERAKLFLYWLSQFGTKLEAQWNPLVDALVAPVMVFIAGRFNEPELYDGIVGPVFLLLPFLLWKVKKNQTIKVLYLFCGLFIYYWAMTTKQARFLIPVLPVFSILMSYGLSQGSKPLLRKLVIAGLALNGVLGFWHMSTTNPFRFWVGQENRQEYLSRVIHIYPAYRAIRQFVPPDAKVYLLQMKTYGYYLDVDWEGDFIFETHQLSQLLESKPSMDEIHQFFTSRGVSYLAADYAFMMDKKVGLKADAWELLKEYFRTKCDLIIEFGPYVLLKLK